LISWNAIGAIGFRPTIVRSAQDGATEEITEALGDGAEKFIVALEIWATSAMVVDAVSSATRFETGDQLRQFHQLGITRSRAAFSPPARAAEPETNCKMKLQIIANSPSRVFRRLSGPNQKAKSGPQRRYFRRRLRRATTKGANSSAARRNLSKLASPDRSRVLDQFTEYERSYVVSNNIDGTNLRDLVRLEWTDGRKVGLGLARGFNRVLDYLHRQSSDNSSRLQSGKLI